MRGAALMLAALATIVPAFAASRPYKVPTDPAPVMLPPGPGAEVTANTCAACHSLDYLTNQPRGKGAQFWKDSVAKMINVYGASIEKPDAEAIADYLARTYG